MSDSPPMTPRGRATHTRIVRAAVDVIAGHGATDMSLDLVMRRAGVSKGQLYHYFDDRAALVHAAVDATVDDVVTLQRSMMEALDTWQGIRTWFDCLIALQVTLDARGGCPMAMLSAHLVETDEIVRSRLIAGFERWEGMLERGLTSMRAAGLLVGDAQPRELSIATMASIQGGLVLTQVRRDPEQLRIALTSAWSYLQSHAAAPD
ncbi:MAG: TetR/AcrR family transcriptional regulator [Thermoleophilia bacterium]|nr:TetR/AcrR family transcriptional regulator [Thermoleophilia bacterium]